MVPFSIPRASDCRLWAIQPTACFWMVQELRMIFTFFLMVKKRKQGIILVVQWLRIHFVGIPWWSSG